MDNLFRVTLLGLNDSQLQLWWWTDWKLWDFGYESFTTKNQTNWVLRLGLVDIHYTGGKK